MNRTQTRRTIPTPAGALSLLESGGEQRPTLLLIHGSFGQAHLWDHVIENLPPGRRVAALDMPGHGESEHSGQYAMAEIAAGIDAAIRAIDGPVVLAGHSIGSAASMLAASLGAPNLVAAVFLDIDPCPPERQALHLNDVGSKPARVYETFEDAVARESRAAPNAAKDVQVHLARHGYREQDGKFHQRFDQKFLADVRTWDMRPVLPLITVPALVLRGADSTVMSPAGYDDMLAGLPNAKGQLIPGAGHQLQLEQPAAVAAAIEAFIAGLA